jgi:hypothetical protein
MKPRRIQLSRKKGWRLPANTVVVSRPSKWGNPFRIRRDPGGRCWLVNDPDSAGDRAFLDRGRATVFAVVAFRGWLIGHPYGLEVAAEAKQLLRGKNLACWCPIDQPCHADVLLEVANANPD